MRIENGKVVLEPANCRYCRHYYGDDIRPGQIREAVRVPCPRCHGTGRTKGGKGKGRCTYGSGTGAPCFFGEVVDHYEVVTCPECEGNPKGKSVEQWTDTIPDRWWQNFEFRVFRSDRPQTTLERLIGAGVYSCTDYGAWKRMSDEELISKVRDDAHSRVQLCKIVRAKDDLTIADYIGIYCNDQGYTPAASWKDW